jgi:hypothetical protein
MLVSGDSMHRSHGALLTAPRISPTPGLRPSYTGSDTDGVRSSTVALWVHPWI